MLVKKCCSTSDESGFIQLKYMLGKVYIWPQACLAQCCKSHLIRSNTTLSPLLPWHIHLLFSFHIPVYICSRKILPALNVKWCLSRVPCVSYKSLEWRESFRSSCARITNISSPIQMGLDLQEQRSNVYYLRTSVILMANSHVMSDLSNTDWILSEKALI